LDTATAFEVEFEIAELCAELDEPATTKKLVELLKSCGVPVLLASLRLKLQPYPL